MKTLLFPALLLVGLSVTSQPLLQQQVLAINTVLQKNHFSPAPVNDSLSVHVFNAIIENADADKLYLTSQAVADLNTFRYQLDDELAGKAWGFSTRFKTIYKAALKKTDSILQVLAQQPVSLDKPGSYTYGEAANLPANTVEQQQRWTRYLQSRILNSLYNVHKNDSVKTSLQTVLKEEPGERKKITTAYRRQIGLLLADTTLLDNTISNIYLKSIAACYDPHSEFFPPQEKKAFDEALSSQNMKYGFGLQESEEGDFIIISVVPGSPAWNSGSIHVNDKLIAVKVPGGAAAEPANITRAQLDSIFNNPGQVLEMTVQSADGKTSTVSLQKAWVNNEDNFVKGYVLEQGGHKTGYISLPSFYSGWDGESGSSCANDVAKEIVKLKRDSIEALLLDMRYNGGGSVEEAIELAGIFIDAGPMAVEKERDGKTIALKDPARGTIYDGPLGVMINGQSASATELVAGTLQDYNRAVIIGSNSFGKATMQVVLPMDTSLTLQKITREQKFDDSKGFVKVTIGKLYRITGNSNQLKGVAPDISLPDAFEAYDYSESQMPFALPQDTVMKHIFYTPLKPLPIAQLATESRQRIAGSPYFNAKKLQVEKTRKTRAAETIPLQWDAYLQWRSEQESTASKNNSNILFNISNAGFDNKLVALDPYQKEQSERTKKQLQQDGYIDEALKVMAGLVIVTK